MAACIRDKALRDTLDVVRKARNVSGKTVNGKVRDRLEDPILEGSPARNGQLKASTASTASR